jgi:hemerythrin-like domain-containing protein
MAQQRKRTSAKSRGQGQRQRGQAKSRSRSGQKRRTSSGQSRTAASKSRATGGGARRGRTSSAGRTRSASRQHAASRGTRDAIGLLRADHVRVKSLFRALQQATSEARRTSVLDDIEAALREHTTIEEQVFYPAFREAAKTDKDRRLFHEANEEHHVVDVVLPEVRDARHEPDVFAARAKVLRELVLHHIEEEQDEMFPRARQLFSEAELRDLGAQLNERKRAEQQPTGTLEKVGAMIGLSPS